MNGLLWEKEIRQAEHVRLLGRLDPQQPVFSMFFTGSGVELRLRDVYKRQAQSHTW